MSAKGNLKGIVLRLGGVVNGKHGYESELFCHITSHCWAENGGIIPAERDNCHSIGTIVRE